MININIFHNLIELVSIFHLNSINGEDIFLIVMDGRWRKTVLDFTILTEKKKPFP